MSDMDNAIISAIVGGITGFLASRLSNYLDNRGKITIKAFNEKLQYSFVDSDGFTKFSKNYNNKATTIRLSFTLEIRNTAKIRKDYKNGKLIIRTYNSPDEAALLYMDNDFAFQHSMMEPLESNIIRLKSEIKTYRIEELLGKEVEFYVSITDSKDNITEVLVGTYDKL